MKLSGLSNFQKYAHWVLFVLFEVIAFVLIVSFNHNQRDIFLHSSSVFSGSVLKRTAEIGDYMSLGRSNDELLAENARLLQELISTPKPTITEVPDTTVYPYAVIPARVINNSIHASRNYFTIDKGSKDGISASMGVITMSGVAGIVKQVSHRYATVLSLVNTEIKVSASVDGASYFGTISWDGRNYQRLTLTGIPKHASINRGDLISTNGYSTIFAEGIPIGTIEAFDVSKNGVFYEVSVDPVTDFAEMNHVYILKDNFAAERLAVEANE